MNTSDQPKSFRNTDKKSPNSARKTCIFAKDESEVSIFYERKSLAKDELEKCQRQQKELKKDRSKHRFLSDRVIIDIKIQKCRKFLHQTIVLPDNRTLNVGELNMDQISLNTFSKIPDGQQKINTSETGCNRVFKDKRGYELFSQKIKKVTPINLNQTTPDISIDNQSPKFGLGNPSEDISQLSNINLVQKSSQNLNQTERKHKTDQETTLNQNTERKLPLSKPHNTPPDNIDSFEFNISPRMVNDYNQNNLSQKKENSWNEVLLDLTTKNDSKINELQNEQEARTKELLGIQDIHKDTFLQTGIEKKDFLKQIECLNLQLVQRDSTIHNLTQKMTKIQKKFSNQNIDILKNAYKDMLEKLKFVEKSLFDRTNRLINLEKELSIKNNENKELLKNKDNISKNLEKLYKQKNFELSEKNDFIKKSDINNKKVFDEFENKIINLKKQLSKEKQQNFVISSEFESLRKNSNLQIYCLEKNICCNNKEILLLRSKIEIQELEQDDIQNVMEKSEIEKISKNCVECAKQEKTILKLEKDNHEMKKKVVQRDNFFSDLYVGNGSRRTIDQVGDKTPSINEEIGSPLIFSRKVSKDLSIKDDIPENPNLDQIFDIDQQELINIFKNEIHEKKSYIAHLERDLDTIHSKLEEFAKVIQEKDLELCEIYEFSKKFNQKDEKIEVLYLKLSDNIEMFKEFEEQLNELEETRQTILILEEKIEEKDGKISWLNESTYGMEQELLSYKEFVKKKDQEISAYDVKKRELDDMLSELKKNSQSSPEICRQINTNLFYNKNNIKSLLESINTVDNELTKEDVIDIVNEQEGLLEKIQILEESLLEKSKENELLTTYIVEIEGILDDYKQNMNTLDKKLTEKNICIYDKDSKIVSQHIEIKKQNDKLEKNLIAIALLKFEQNRFNNKFLIINFESVLYS